MHNFIINITDALIFAFNFDWNSDVSDEIRNQFCDATMRLKIKLIGRDFSEYGKYIFKLSDLQETQSLIITMKTKQ